MVRLTRPNGTAPERGKSPAPGLLGCRPSPAHALARTLGLLARQAPLPCIAVLALSLLPGLAAGVTVLATRRLFAQTLLLPAARAPFLEAATAYAALLLAQDLLPRATGLPTLFLNEGLQTTIQRLFLEHVGRLELAALDHPLVQDVIGRVRGVIESGRLLWTSRRVIFLPRAVLAAAGIATGLLALSPTLAVAAALAALPTAIQRWRLGPAFYTFAAFQTRRHRVLGYIGGLLTSRGAAAEVRAFRLAPLLLHRWRTTQQALLEERWAFEWRRLPGELAAQLLGTGAVGYGLGLAWSLWLCLDGHLSVAACAAALTALWAFQEAFRYVVIDLAAANTEGLALGDLLAILDATATERVGGRPFPSPLRRGIALEGVTFTYPGQDHPALQDVTLRIAAGERVALVGGNGAGKTTLVRVLLGFYQPQQGRVTVDDVPLQQIAPASLRAHAAAVFQEPVRYMLPLRDNIALVGQEDAILAATMGGGLESLLAQLPAGLDTWLDPARPGGVSLSGGQWQRVALARAAMREADLVVLDEPTTALDPHAESAAVRRLLEAARGRTALVVSHRLGIARLCDRVLVLDGGRVVEEGPHDALVQRGGRYAAMWATQAGWYG